MTKRLAGFLGGVSLVAFAAAGTAVYVPRIETRLERAAVAELRAAGIEGVTPVADGRRIVLSGRVGSREWARAAVARVAAVPGARRVVDRLAVSSPAESAE